MAYSSRRVSKPLKRTNPERGNRHRSALGRNQLRGSDRDRRREILGILGGNWAKSLPPRRQGGTGANYGELLEYEMKNVDVMDGAFEASLKLRVTRIN